MISVKKRNELSKFNHLYEIFYYNKKCHQLFISLNHLLSMCKNGIQLYFIPQLDAILKKYTCNLFDRYFNVWTKSKIKIKKFLKFQTLVVYCFLVACTLPSIRGGLWTYYVKNACSLRNSLLKTIFTIKLLNN